MIDWQHERRSSFWDGFFLGTVWTAFALVLVAFLFSIWVATP
jgi:hypothetical protein